MERCTKEGEPMLSKDIQQWHLERQIQQIASVRPEGEVSRILYEHKGKYIDAAAMTASCRVYYISKCVYSSGFRLKGSTPGLLDIVYVYQGSLTLSHTGTVTQAGPGSLVLLQENVQALLVQNDSGPAELLLIRSTGELTDNFYRMIYRQTGAVQAVSGKTMDTAAETLLYYMKYPADAANTRLALIMTQLFTGILLNAMDRSAPKHPEWFVSAVDYIEQNYQKEISVEQLAKYVQISTPHFHRLFLKYTGQSPYQYILDFRIQKAKLLLSDPVLQIKQIGREVGFHNVNHFIRHFKRITGVTPGQYRAGRL